jgi:predicted nucleic acid binding AN1-type Zn finger protein
MDKKPKSNRCNICRKKVGLLAFTCECSDTLKFCSAHRYPETHLCSFDHKNKGRTILANKLVKVEGEKLVKI